MTAKTARQTCPQADLHTVVPSAYSSYRSWHYWAAVMSQTHEQRQCPGCGRWTIWAPRP